MQDVAKLRAVSFVMKGGAVVQRRSAAGQERQRTFDIQRGLDARHRLSMQEYAELLQASSTVRFGTRNVLLDAVPVVRAGALRLKRIEEFHRIYEWA